MVNFRIHKFPKTRVATIDVCEIGMQKHHIAAMLEFDVTEAREKIKTYKKNVGKISFTAWIIKVISDTIKKHEGAAAYLKGKRRIVIFDDINVSMIVEKESAGQKVPIPLIIEKANERSIESITKQITDAKTEVLSENEIVLQSKASKLESFYYNLPGFLRRFIWRSMLKRPSFIYSKMGNVAVTSIGMMGSINGWFIPKSIHPICFG
ncbi:MAG: dehydrogenase, partial [Bacteroidetes bacterium HGW-Bacteroidetes-15]